MKLERKSEATGKWIGIMIGGKRERGIVSTHGALLWKHRYETHGSVQ